ncbi:MAG: aldose epimerase family protein [Pseudomonadota bacterium]
MAITQVPFGEAASLFRLSNANGLCARISNFGGIVVGIDVPDRDGRMADVCLGFDTLAPYETVSPYFGALIGRYANRIANARFKLDGQHVTLAANDGVNHLHGGSPGFDRALWQAHIDGDWLLLDYTSADGEQGFPGELRVRAAYSFNDDNELVLLLSATCDRPTPVNLTSHAYFNLAGEGDVLDHVLMIDADAYLPLNAQRIPTGQFAPVAGSIYDFRTARVIGQGGYDHNFVLNAARGPAARVLDPHSGRMLEVWTDAPGLQFYSANFLDGTLSGKGRRYRRHSGLCLEPQRFPDSPNQPHFPDTILRPGAVYQTEMRYRFSVYAISG